MALLVNITKRRKAALPDTQEPQDEYFTLEQALGVLGVQAQTLYAYVSRGLVRRITAPSGRASLYLREDVERAKARSASRARGPGGSRQRRLHTAEPALLTGLTEITPRGPRYRHRHALSLAHEGHGFETVAEYLWTGEWTADVKGWSDAPKHAEVIEVIRAGARMREGVHLLDVFKLGAVALGISEGSRLERLAPGNSPDAAARRFIRVLAGSLGFIAPAGDFVPLQAGETIAAGVARIFLGRKGKAAAAAIDSALVLAADHELNPATYAARVAASTNADLNSCLVAALGVQFGPLLGRSCDTIASLLAPGLSRELVLAKMRRYLGGDRSPPGFNHLLYPEGDPRAAYLMELARERAAAGSEVRATLELVGELEREFGLRPKIDLGLVMLVRSLGLPDAAASGLFAVGRSAGWVAHVLEQRMAGFLIRPRALYHPDATSGLEH